MKRYIVINSEGKIIEDKYLNGEIITDEFCFEVDLDFNTENKRFINNEWIEYYENTQIELPPLLENKPNPVELPEALYLQLDMIEAKIDKSQQDIIDDYTLKLIEEGVI